ncbi:lasso peptide biosynthesis B2 protein [Nonomuraea sp. NPDC050404]|uniref:lasso peptide biosynthesis B2 protein n=1 Tax=Nonomuraea sp. NPDC050404 TaxID=3155783 RepID=UPI0033DCE626
MSSLAALPEPVPLTRREHLEGRLALISAWYLLLLYRDSPRMLAAYLAGRARTMTAATAEQTAYARSVITTISPRCGSDRGCLLRSTATAFLCQRRHRSWPTWRTGMRYPPLMSHAWLEAEGRPIGEDPSTIALYTVVFTVPSGETA